MNRPKYSREQYDAITHFIGPALVVAGPGSGKTSVIIGRVNFLIKHYHINPTNILVITFSKLAALQMQQRFMQSNPDNYYPVNFGTFHSLFFSIIKQYYRYGSDNIASNKYKSNVLKNILKHHSEFDTSEQELIDSLIKRISYYKNSGLKKDIDEHNGISCEMFMEIFKEYENVCRQDKKIDFEDMMLICRDLLLNNKEVREHYIKRFRFILIDEYQDINDLQYDTVRLLLGDEKNIFAVGDDDQSIYGFRGSNPNIMLSFEREYPNAHIVRMLCNFRSTGYIVQTSGKIIGENHNRIEKKIYTYNDMGANVQLVGFESKEAQYEYIIDRLRLYSNNMTDNKGNIAILFRTHAQFSYLSDRLQKEGIKCNIKEKPFNVYETEIFLDFMRYLRLCQSKGEYDRDDFVAVMNKPARYISRNLVLGSVVHPEMLKSEYSDKEYMMSILKKFERDLRIMSRMDIFAAFNFFRYSIGYEEYYIKRCECKEKRESALKLFEEIKERCRGFNLYQELELHVKEYTALIKQPVKAGIEKNGIYIMTFHASKGLEFDEVVIPDCNDGTIPHNKALSEAGIEEERRLLYVAMTRAEKKLTLSYVKGDADNEHIPSRFLKEIGNK